MKNKKRLWFAIGPFIVSILGLILLLAISTGSLFQPSKKQVSEAASSMSLAVLKGNVLKNTAVSSGEYLPFFGSSELSRVNEFHPSVLARKYKRGYEPLLLGAPGTQSLTHYFLIDSMKEELRGKKIVFIISPQWFVKEGVNDQAFSLHYSPLQVYNWVKNVEKVGEKEKSLANRLLDFSKVNSDKMLKSTLEDIRNGKNLTESRRNYFEFMFNILSREDLLFKNVDIPTKEGRIKRAEKNLPDVYDFDSLDKLAYDIAKKKTSNNEFQISNTFYTTRLSKAKVNLKNSQKKFNYVNSKEFSDFQLVLNELSENNIEPLFVITPVNKKWSDYTGLSEEMLNEFSEKVTKQLKSQGFDNIVDYTDKRGEEYFMEDTIHIGWRGWLNLDRELQSFLEKDKDKSKKLTIDNASFLSKAWEKR